MPLSITLWLRHLVETLTGQDRTPTPDGPAWSPDPERGPPWKIQHRRRTAVEPYFETLNRMERAIIAYDFERAVPLVHENMDRIPAFVETEDPGLIQDVSFPCFRNGGMVLAMAGDDAGIERMANMVDAVPGLGRWRDEVAKHVRDRVLFRRILDAVGENPGCLQTGVKKLVGEKDGRNVARLLAWLDKAGRIERVRHKRTYSIRIADPADAARKLKERREYLEERERRFQESGLGGRRVIASIEFDV